MTAVRWILWLAVGGAALWVWDYFFGGGLPEGIVTPEERAAPEGTVGERGTGAARGARYESWQTLFSDGDEMYAWRREWAVEGSVASPGVEDADTSSTILTNWITVGESCNPGTDSVGYTEPITTEDGGTSQTVAHCRRQGATFVWVRVGEQNT